MATTWCDPGGDATYHYPNNLRNSAFDLYSGGTQSMTSPLSTEIVHGGHKYAIKFKTTTNYCIADTGLPAAGGRYSAYVYIDTYPTAVATLMSTWDAAGSQRTALRITATGVLQLWNTTTAQIGTNGPVLQRGRWYRLSCAYTTVSTVVSEWRVFVDGVSAISVTNPTLTSIAWTTFMFGNHSNSASMVTYMSDLYCDNDTSLTDTGDIWVTAKRVKANGTTNQFNQILGATNNNPFGSGNAPQVNNRSLEQYIGIGVTNTTQQTELYTVQTASEGDMDITGRTIVDVVGWIVADVASTSNSPVHNMIINGVSGAKTLTTSAATYFLASGTTTYPSGGDAIGMNAQYTSVATQTRLRGAFLMIVFLGDPGNSVKNIPSMNRTMHPRMFAPGNSR